MVNLKKFILSLYALSLCLAAAAQPATNTTTSFMVNGLKVIFKPTVKEEISVRMFFRGGVYNYRETQAGIENFALKAVTQCGTQKFSANTFRDMEDSYSIGVGGASTLDYGDVEMECISKYFDQGWALFAEAINHPIFEPNEVGLLRSKLINQVNTKDDDPDEHIDRLMIRNAFLGTPYAIDPDGNEKTLSALTATQLKAYYFNLLNKNRMFIVVAGKISRERLEQKIRASFATLPARPYIEPQRTAPHWTTNNVTVEGRQTAINYIQAAMNAPPVNSPELLPYRMAMSALGGSLFADLRTRRNLSYDPGAFLVTQLMPYGVMHVSTNDPKQAVAAMTDAVNRLKTLGISDSGLVYLRNGLITSNYIKQQSSGAITADLGTAEIDGGWQSSETFVKRVNAVTVDQVDNALNRYVIGIRWAYLGDPNLAQQAADSFAIKVISNSAK